VKKYTVKIIFPEGAHDFKLDIPFAIDTQTQTKTFSYLDFWGRPTLIVEKDNVLEYHNQQFSAAYTFETNKLLIEPLYVFAGFLGLFALLILLGRIDLGLEKKKIRSD